MSSGRGKEEAINGDFDFIISNQNRNLHLFFFILFLYRVCLCSRDLWYEDAAEGSLDTEKNKTGMEFVFSKKKNYCDGTFNLRNYISVSKLFI